MEDEVADSSMEVPTGSAQAYMTEAEDLLCQSAISFLHGMARCFRVLHDNYQSNVWLGFLSMTAHVLLSILDWRRLERATLAPRISGVLPFREGDG